MKVSIIIPVYNVEDYIKRCFESVASQAYRDIECIFVDDCSPDNCNALLRDMIFAYEGPIDFFLIRHEQNKGLSGARNTGTEAASGEYIYYLDSDDEITPEAISTLVALVEKYPGVDMVQGNTLTMPLVEKNDDWRDISQKSYPEYSSDQAWIKREILKGEFGIPMNAWNKLLRHNFLKENQLYFKEGIIHEDEHWIFFLAKKINSIAFTTVPSLIHYIVDGSIMRSGDNYKSLRSRLFILNDFVDNIDGVLVREQWHRIWRICACAMMQIKSCGRESELIVEYKAFIKRTLRGQHRFSFRMRFLLMLFLLPGTFYNDSKLGWFVTRLLYKWAAIPDPLVIVLRHRS